MFQPKVAFHPSAPLQDDPVLLVEELLVHGLILLAGLGQGCGLPGVSHIIHKLKGFATLLIAPVVGIPTEQVDENADLVMVIGGFPGSAVAEDVFQYTYRRDQNITSFQN